MSPNWPFALASAEHVVSSTLIASQSRRSPDQKTLKSGLGSDAYARVSPPTAPEAMSPAISSKLRARTDHEDNTLLLRFPRLVPTKRGADRPRRQNHSGSATPAGFEPASESDNPSNDS